MSNILSHQTITVAATNATYTLPRNAVSIVLRCPSTNAGTTYIMIDSTPSNSTEGTPIRANETINVDLTQNIAALQTTGAPITAELFMRSVAVIGTAADVLYLDVVTWV